MDLRLSLPDLSREQVIEYGLQEITDRTRRTATNTDIEKDLLDLQEELDMLEKYQEVGEDVDEDINDVKERIAEIENRPPRYIQTDPNEFIRSYAIFLNIVKEFIIEVMKRNQPVDDYGVLIQETLKYIVQQVL